MALQPSAESLNKRRKRKLSAGDDDDTKMMDSMNPSKRHTETQRPKDPNPGIPFEDLDPDNESSDSQFEYTFYDEDKDPNNTNKPFVPISDKTVKTKRRGHSNNRMDTDGSSGGLIGWNPPNKEIRTVTRAVDLNWSDSDECMEQEEDKNTKNSQNTVDERAFLQDVSHDALQNSDLSTMKHTNSAYNVLFKFSTQWPSLSFDVIKDDLGVVRTAIPFSMYLVTGTQANVEHGKSVRDIQEEYGKNVRYGKNMATYEKQKQNKIQFLKLSEIQKTKYDDDEDEENEEKDNEYFNINDENPTMQNRDIIVSAIVNRIRAKRSGDKHLVAAMLSDGNLEIYNSTQHILSLDGLSNISAVEREKKAICRSRHEDEGYAVDWCPLANECRLATGSCAGELRLYSPKQSHFVRTLQFKTLKPSIEDIQWSPTNKDIFVSVGCDKCIRVWDTRNNKKEHVARIQNAHKQDINVCSWNPHSGHDHLLLTGSDDRSFKIWDLRRLSGGDGGYSKKLKKCAHYFVSSWHVKPITSVQWHPQESSCAIVASEDNQISIWDFSLEEDTSEKPEGATLRLDQKLPPQLVFLHGGQTDVKEVHFHPQIPNMCISTAETGFHLFQPDNLMESLKNEFDHMQLID